jgi:ABC-type transport system substrate-binding protein/serine/threonine protein kinase
VADRVGQHLGNYRLVSLLGQGGYAEVYLGQHVRLNQQAAIKVLHAHLTEQEAEHFQQEAQTIATLVHPGIIRVFDYDVQDGVPFLVMDYAPNGTLRRRYAKGSLVPMPVIVSSVKQVADALQYAHDQKFIHRDVKPENMLLGRRQEVLLSDFGIATIAHSTSSLNVGAEGASGTLAYMAPEQIEGHPRPASDQYALGVVVYEWLCGERPFEGSASEVMAQHLSVPPPSLRERLPEISPEVEQVVLHSLAKDPKARFASVAEFASALEQVSQRFLTPTAQLASQQPVSSPGGATGYETLAAAPDQPVFATETTPSADLPVGALEPTVYPDSAVPHSLDTPQRGASSETPQSGQLLAPTVAVVSPPLEPTMPVQRRARRVSRTMAGILVGLAVLVVAGGILGSLSLLAHFGVIGAHNAPQAPIVSHGGTWTIGSFIQPDSLIPFVVGNSFVADNELDQALYLPLFYSDGFGVIYPGAASEVPTVQNGGISADAKTWTFHLRPHLVWSDGQPYDARDVEFTLNLTLNPQFNPGGYLSARNLLRSVVVSADHLSITFHFSRGFASFLEYWEDGGQDPLPAHHFDLIPPGQILNPPDLLNPQVTSGPFMMAESVPGNHFTLIRNPRYYLASKGLPYLDKLVFRILAQNAINTDLQDGTIDSTSVGSMDVQNYQHLHSYALVTPPTSINFEAQFFNFHNTVLASHLEVRQAIATAIDNPALIKYENTIYQPGAANLQCTDHSSFYHPGFDPTASCPIFNPAVANKLLDDNGWVKGPDGVRTKGGQRLEFEYSAPINSSNEDRYGLEAIIQQNMRAIGIKLDIQNYPENLFFSTFLTGGKASPPTGALAGKFDIAEYTYSNGSDPDDSGLLGCEPPFGPNNESYCNPALDALYKQELATANQGTRQIIFDQIHSIYLTDFPLIVLFGSYSFYIVHKGTHNFLPSPLFWGDTINIWEWWCDQGKC